MGTQRGVLLALVILVAGLAMSAAGGVLWRADQRAQDRQTARIEAANVTATLSSLVRRDADLVTTLRAVLAMNPNLGPTAFMRWYTGLDGDQRQVGGIGSAVLASVPAARLRSFEARRDGDPTFRALIGRWLTRVVPGAEPEYCLLAAGGALVPLNALTAPLVQEDWCSPTSAVGPTQRPILSAATDTGEILAYPVQLPQLSTVFLEAAFYRPGAPVRTVAERRAARLGWVVSSFDMQSLLRLALGHNRGLAVSLFHVNPGAAPALVGSAGRQVADPAITLRTPVPVDGSWLIVARAAAPPGMTPTGEGLMTFAGGALVSLLLAVLVLVLSRSRARALTMVADKTAQLRHQALHDDLTGLPNRVLALDRAEGMLARARRSDTSVAALYIDIDGFKQINDTFGHQAGDRFLQQVAERLLTVLRESDTAARLAGDEFLVLLEGSTLDAGPELVAERLLDVLREPYRVSEDSTRPVSVSASIGVACGRRSTAEELLADADLALYEAKEAGRDRYVMFESNMLTAAQDRLALGLDLAAALEAEELFLVYQPTFDLNSERAVGAEALLRWRHPTRGIVPPGDFIPLAEETGQIVPIGRWVLDRACHQAADWHARGHKLSISVNVSGRQLERDDLVDDVADALAMSGLDPSALVVELTETTLMRDPAAAGRLARLKELGVRVAIDDFGTGYSSLAYLRRFPVDALKIDRSFITGLPEDKASVTLVCTLVQLGKTLGLETVAEGIEEPSQLRELQREHCDHGQGFLLARPLTLEAFDEFLEAQPTAGELASAD